MNFNIIKSPLPDNLILGDFITIQENVKIGSRTRICNYANLYGCSIGQDCVIGPYVEIQKNAIIGDKTRVGSHSFICSNVIIGKNCFIAHGVMFTNDSFKNNRVNFDPKDWEYTHIGDNVIISSNVTLLPVKIGSGCIIGAGAVVTKDIPDDAIVWGNPAKIHGQRKI